MKKRLEADLISIAHKILKLKNKSDIDQLFFETQKLYEKLAVLRFIEGQYSDLKPTIGKSEMIHDFENYSEAIQNESLPTHKIPLEINKENFIAPTVVIETDMATVEVAAVIQENQQIDKNAMEELVVETNQAPEVLSVQPESLKTNSLEDFIETGKKTLYSPFIKKILKGSSFINETNNEAIQENNKEEKVVNEVEKKSEPKPISFNELIGTNYFQELQFVKVENSVQVPPIPKTEPELKVFVPKAEEIVKPAFVKPPSSINDRFSKKIEIDLNDQIAFVKHLFDNKLEDYNRALGQINTLVTYNETKNFIETMIKPDHNYWKDKTEYEDRFMHCIEKKFL